MPAPVSPAARLPWNGTVAAPPPEPVPSLLESVPAAFRTSQDEIPWEQDGRVSEAYRPIIDALNERIGGPSLTRTSPYYRIAGAGKATALTINRDRVWQDIARARASDPKAFSNLPATQKEYEDRILTRDGARARDQVVAARGGIVPQLIGGIAAQAVDPVNLALGVATGGLSAETTLLRGMLIEGALNAGIEAAETPVNIQARARLGEQTTATDVATNIGTAFAFGAGLHGAIGGAQAGFEKTVTANWDRLPQGLRDRWTARTQLNPAADDKLLADMSAALIGPERMTEAEAGAAAALARQAEIDGASPFMANGAGTAAHLDALGERMAAILHDTPAEKPAFVPPARGERLGGMGDTALATGTVAGDSQSRFMARVRRAESSGNDAAQAATSSAYGRYQFTAGTWIGYYTRRFGTGGLTRKDILAKRADPHLQDMLMADLTADNAARLRRIGAPVTEGNLYLAHLLGPADAEKVLRAGADTPLAGLIHEGSIDANKWMRKMTAADIRQFAARKMGSAGDDGAGLHLNAPDGMDTSLAAQIDAELAAVRAQAEQLDAELRGRGMDTDAMVRDAEQAGMGPDGFEPVPVEQLGPDGLARPLAEPVRPLDRPANEGAPPEAQALAPALRPIVNDKTRDLNDLDGIAAELGVTAAEVRTGLLELVKAKSGIRIRKKDGAFVRAAPSPVRDMSLIEWIKKGGGIWDGDGFNFKGGDLAAMGLDDWYKGGPFRDKKPIIRTAEQGHGNRGADNVLRAAVEAGYFPELRAALDGSGPDSLDTNDLLKAIEAELRGEPRFAVGTRSYERAMGSGNKPAAPGAAPMDAFRHPADDDPFLHDMLRHAAAANGIDPALLDDELLNYAARMAYDGPAVTEWGDVLTRALNDISDATRWDAVDETGDVRYEDTDYDWPHTSENPEPGSEAGAAARDRGGPEGIGSDARAGGEKRGPDGGNGESRPPPLEDMPRGETTRFLDPTGDAAKAQIDALEHDARMAASGAADINTSDGFGTMGREAYNRAHGNMWMLSLDELERLKEAAKLSETALLQSAIENIGFVPSEKLARLLESDHFYHDRVVSMIEKEAEAAGLDIPPEADRVLNPKWDDPPLSNLPMSEDVQAIIEANLDGGDTDPHMLASHLGWALRDLKPDDMRAVLEGRGDATAQAHMAKLRLAYQTMHDIGVRPDQIPERIVAAMVQNGNSPAIAEELTRMALEGLRQARDPMKSALDNGAAVDPNIAAKTRQEADIAAQQPLTGARKTGAAQDPAMPEGLFGGPQEPVLFDMGDGSKPRPMDDLLRDLEQDAADNATIRGCMDPNPGAGA